jgi:hypothetical protein
MIIETKNAPRPAIGRMAGRPILAIKIRGFRPTQAGDNARRAAKVGEADLWARSASHWA